MATLTQTRSALSLLWQTLRFCGLHFLPPFAIDGLPWAVFALIPILLGQDQTFADLRNSQVPIALEQLYPFFWAVLYGALVSSPWSTALWPTPAPRPSSAGPCGCLRRIAQLGPAGAGSWSSIGVTGPSSRPSAWS